MCKEITYNTAGLMVHKHSVIILNSFLKILTYLFTVIIRNAVLLVFKLFIMNRQHCWCHNHLGYNVWSNGVKQTFKGLMLA